MPRSTIHLLLLVLVAVLPVLWLAWGQAASPATRADGAVSLKVQVAGDAERIDLLRNDDGTYTFLVDPGQPNESSLSPDELAARLFRGESSRDWLHRLFNISSPIGFLWVSIGLLGQMLFTGRMMVQWLATERRKQSIVPPIFWWMSLIGAMMLLTYFLWRRDIVGVLGQSFGLIVYVRNLQYIRSATKPQMNADEGR